MVGSRTSVKNRQQETRRAAQMMKRILIHFRGQMDEQLRPQGVTTAQLHVMKIIREEPGASGAQLARACYVTPQSAQTLLKQLEKGGWIRRVKDSMNDRILTAELTQSGERLLLAAEKAAKVIEARLWQGVPESSVKTLNTVLERCLENLEGEA
jgi:MarR family transcriptional regulator, organic hydroperoxide resistance regulator